MLCKTAFRNYPNHVNPIYLPTNNNNNDPTIPISNNPTTPANNTDAAPNADVERVKQG